MSDNLCAEAGYVLLNKAGEALCGDRVEVAGDPDALVLVLADGLGNGVKANILATLTAKILATMIAGGMPLDECVDTVVRTLPVCRERGIAYATFSVVRTKPGREVELIQFDNPPIIALRGGALWDYPAVAGKSPGAASWRAASSAGGRRVPGAVRRRDLRRGGARAQPRMAAGGHRPLRRGAVRAWTLGQGLRRRHRRRLPGLYGGQPGDDATVAACGFAPGGR